MRYEDNIVDQVSAANDIVDIISQYIPMKRSGRNFKACCPFHQEKTASFMVNPEKQFFHCFGCGVGGDVFSFVMRYENLNFPETLRRLADRANIVLPKNQFQKEETSQKEKFYEIYKLATHYYQALLFDKEKGKDARDYLRKRGISLDIVKEFKLGWAPNEWRGLFDYLIKKGFSESILSQSSLIHKSEQGHYYDVFRERIIFPISNLQDKVMAFGGRLIKDAEGPKYLNSPENPVFSKRKELFGLNLSRKHIDRDRRSLIAVEGYMDFLALYRNGFKNVVATLGTSLSDEHARIMKRFSDEVIVLYDGDRAGVDAALRGVDVLLEGGVHVKVMVLPKGDDPDDFLQKRGNKDFQELLKNSKDFFDFKLDVLLQRFSRKDPLGLVKITDAFFETFIKIKSPILLAEYLKKLSNALSVNENSLREEYLKLENKTTSRTRVSEEAFLKKNKSILVPPEELLVLALMLMDLKFCKKAILEISELDWNNDFSRDFFILLKDVFQKDEKRYSQRLLSQIKDIEYKEKIIAVIAHLDDVKEREKVFLDCLKKIKEHRSDDRLRELMRLISDAERAGNAEHVAQYAKEYQGLLRESKRR